MKENELKLFCKEVTTFFEENSSLLKKAKRFNDIDDVYFTPVFSKLLDSVTGWKNIERTEVNKGKFLTLAVLTCVLTRIKSFHTDYRISFARSLGKTPHHDDTPLLNETRFNNLIQTNDFNLFFDTLMIAIKVLNYNVNLRSVIETVVNWIEEHRGFKHKNKADTLAFKMSTEYNT